MDEVSEFALFRAIVETGRISAAAAALQSSPAAVSRRLSALEARLGVRLAERSSRRFRLTDEGILVAQSRASRTARDIPRSREGLRPRVDVNLLDLADRLLIDTGGDDRNAHNAIKGGIEGGAEDDVGFLVDLLADAACRLVDFVQSEIVAAGNRDQESSRAPH